MRAKKTFEKKLYFKVRIIEKTNRVVNVYITSDTILITLNP